MSLLRALRWMFIQPYPPLWIILMFEFTGLLEALAIVNKWTAHRTDWPIAVAFTIIMVGPAIRWRRRRYQIRDAIALRRKLIHLFKAMPSEQAYLDDITGQVAICQRGRTWEGHRCAAVVAEPVRDDPDDWRFLTPHGLGEFLRAETFTIGPGVSYVRHEVMIVRGDEDDPAVPRGLRGAFRFFIRTANRNYDMEKAGISIASAAELQTLHDLLTWARPVDIPDDDETEPA